jgi:acyl-CoA thioesterase I
MGIMTMRLPLSILCGVLALAQTQVDYRQLKNGPFYQTAQRDPSVIDDTAHGFTLAASPYWVNGATGDVFQMLSATNNAASWARLPRTYALPLDVAGASVQAAYSVRLLKAGYAGNAMTITRASDSTTKALTFVGGYVDIATAAQFCQGTTCSVTTWNDQSGNARDCTQATRASAPTILTDTLGNGVTLTFDGVTASQYCTMPAGVAITLPNLSLVVVGQPTRIYSGEVIVNIGPTSSNEYGLYSFANSSTYKLPSIIANDPFGLLGTTPADNGPLIMGVTQGANATIYANERSTTVANTGSTFALTGGQIGFESQFSSNFNGNISTVIVKSVAFTTTERANVWQALYRLHGIGPQYAANNWVALGDSITAGTGTAGSDAWPTLAAKSMNVRVVDVGVPGVTCQTLDTNFATYTAPLKLSTARNNILTLLCGTNDLTASRTAAQAWGNIQSIVTQAKAAGFTVLLGTVLPLGASYETARTALNGFITAGYSAAGAVGLIPFASSPVMGQGGQNVPPYFNSDNLHPTAAGYAIMAPIALNAVAPWLQR